MEVTAMDNRLMNPVYRAGGRPGSDAWWKEQDGYGAFRKERNLGWKDVFVSLAGVAITVGGILGIALWLVSLV